MRLLALLLLSALLITGVGCATHTELGGSRAGFTASWSNPYQSASNYPNP